MYGSVCYFSTRSVVNVSTRLQLFRSTFKAILMYSMDSTNHRRSDFAEVETFQINCLRSILGLSDKSKRLAVLVMCGLYSLETDIWRRRFSLLRSAIYTRN